MATPSNPNNYAEMDVIYTNGKKWTFITKIRALQDALTADGWTWYGSLIYHHGYVLTTESKEKAEKVAGEQKMEIKDLAGVRLT